MKNNHSMPNGKTKEKSERTGMGAKGGTTKMFGQQGVNPSKPGQSSVSTSSSNNKFGIPPGTGKGKMAGPQGSDPAIAGTSSPNSGGPAKWGAQGGKGKMFGKQSACASQAGTSSKANC